MIDRRLRVTHPMVDSLEQFIRTDRADVVAPGAILLRGDETRVDADGVCLADYPFTDIRR
jgi:hypothetical protein